MIKNVALGLLAMSVRLDWMVWECDEEQIGQTHLARACSFITESISHDTE
jgi:hypothetical protein